MRGMRGAELFIWCKERIVVLLFLTIIPNNAWPAQGDRQKTQEAVFQIISTSQDTYGTGFVIEGGILVTNFHVLIGFLVYQMSVDPIYIKNKEGHIYFIENLIAADLITDLALLRIKNYNGPGLELALDDPINDQSSFFLIGFPHKEFISMNITKFMDISEVHDYFSNPLGIPLHGASGSPITNEHGRVVAVSARGSDFHLIGTKVNKLQELLDKTRNQRIGNKDIPEWLISKINELTLLATQGHINAQYTLARIFYEGVGVKQNLEFAATWAREAAEQGHPEAQYVLAHMFSHGEGVEKNLEQAVYWTKRAAEQGYIKAQYRLAHMFSHGQGVEKNFEQAVFWAKKVAEQGHAQAQYMLAYMFYNEEGNGEKTLNRLPIGRKGPLNKDMSTLSIYSPICSIEEKE